MIETTKEKIIEKALSIIANEGLKNITIRRIAEESGVNVASLNYHFGSKDELLKEVFLFFGKKISGIFNILNSETGSAELPMRQFIHQYANYTVQYPGVLKAIFSRIMNNEQIAFFIKDIIGPGFSALHKNIQKLIPKANESEIAMKTVHLMSSLVFPVLAGESLKNMAGMKYAEPAIREAYLEMLYADLFSKK
jgi:AcrR family transcriptional regulator